MSLNMFEIDCADYGKVPNMPCYSYNNIITATNVIIVEYLSDQFVHSGAMLPFCLFQHELKHN